MYGLQGWQEAMDRVCEQGECHMNQAEQRQRRCWREWAADAFLGGAKAAHNLVKGRRQQETIEDSDCTQPWELAEKEAQKWQVIWDVNGLNRLPLPSGYDEWEASPALDVTTLRQTIRTFPWSTAVGAG